MYSPSWIYLNPDGSFNLLSLQSVLLCSFETKIANLYNSVNVCFSATWGVSLCSLQHSLIKTCAILPPGAQSIAALHPWPFFCSQSEWVDEKPARRPDPIMKQSPPSLAFFHPSSEKAYEKVTYLAIAARDELRHECRESLCKMPMPKLKIGLQMSGW